jgi:hypothetical protein
MFSNKAEKYEDIPFCLGKMMARLVIVEQL